MYIYALSEVTRALSGNFFCRPGVGLEPKLLIFRSVLLSKGLFQAGTWPLLYTGEFIRIHKQIMRIYSSIVDAGVPVTQRRSHEEVLGVQGVVAPFVLLVVLRVSVLIRTVVKAPPIILVSLLESRGGHRAWIDAVELDLKFLASHSSAFAKIGKSNIAEWIDVIRRKPEAIKDALSKAMCEPDLNKPSAWAKTKKVREIDVTFACDQCAFTAPTRQQLALHSFKVHGHCRLARKCVDTPYCPICLQMFHSRERVICHIEEKSPRCRAVMDMTFSALEPHTVAALDSEDACTARSLMRKGRRRHYCSIMSSRLPGPLCKEAYAVGISHSALLKTPATDFFNSLISGSVASRVGSQHVEV